MRLTGAREPSKEGLTSLSWVERGLPAHDGAVVLLGNGINRTSMGPSWEDVLTLLTKTLPSDVQQLVLDRSKPFPLLYEQIFLNCARCAQLPEAFLLEAVAQGARGMKAGQLHQRVANLPISHLLTTNYDGVTVESFLGSSDLSNAAPVKEARYSLFRRVSNGRTVWQIHGSQDVPGSIMLGYEHYSGYLEQMRRYVTRSVEYQGTRLEGLSARKAHGRDARIHSWIDFFFRSDVGILGLSLDFVEMHLWWLLTYRARQRVTNALKTSNRIAYFAAPESLEPLENRETRARRLEMLQAADVEVIQASPGAETWVHFYESALGRLEDWLNGLAA